MKKLGSLLNSKVSVYLMAVFYVLAGINHFVNPQFYYPLIPDYLPYHHSINISSGLIEIILGVGVFSTKMRSLCAGVLILMLIAFIPSHIYFIQLGSCIADGLCVHPFIGWARLIVIHPLLIYWAYQVGKSEV